MKRMTPFLLALLMLSSASFSYAQTLATTALTGYVYDQQGQGRAGIEVFVVKTLKDGAAVATAQNRAVSSTGGAISLTVVRGSTIYLYSPDVPNWLRNGRQGVAYAIPDTATYAIENLALLSSVYQQQGDTAPAGANGRPVRVAGNTSDTPKFYGQVGTLGVAGIPGWWTLSGSGISYDVPSKTVTFTGGGGGGGGSVVSFSAGNLAPLFTSAVANSTSTPSLTFSLSNAAANTLLGNNSGSTGAPAYNTASSYADAITGLSATGLVKRTGSNAYAVATGGTDYEVPLTFSTGLTRSTNTITVNTTQNIAKLSNLTSNGFVKTSGGDGTLSIDTNTYLTGNQTITLSGDVTGSGATAITTTLANIPTGVPMAGSLLATAIVAPATPAIGKASIYVDSTSKNLAVKNDAGTVNHGVQTRTATASNWIRAIADDGSTTISQPAFTDISGSVAATQMPALTGDVTTSAGAVATTIGANKVTNAMLSQMAAHTFKGNNTGATANAADLTATQLAAELNALLATAALDNLASVSINTSLLAQTGVDLGSATKPFRDLYLFGGGTYGTNYFKFTGTPTAARTITIPDGSLTLARTDAAQTFTGIQTFGSAPVFSTMTAGSVLFAGTSGTLSQSNSNLFWDNSNNRLGIGTASPGVSLEISGTAGTTLLKVREPGSAHSFDFNSRGMLHNYSTETSFRSRFGDNVVTSGRDGIGFNGTPSAAFAASGVAIDAPTAGRVMAFYTSDATSMVERARIDGNGNLGIGTSPSVRLHVYSSNSTTAAVDALQIIGHDSTGTPAAGFGSSLKYQLASSTTAAQDAAQIAALWSDATHASRTAALTFSTVNNAGSLTERLRVTGAGLLNFGSSVSSSTVALKPSTTTLQVRLGDDSADGNLTVGNLTVNGTCTGCGGGGGSGYAAIQEEGTGLTQRLTLNFIGSGVTAADNAGSTRTDVTIHTAGAAQEGTVSTGAQTFGGNKTFNGRAILSGGLALTTRGVTGNATIAATDVRVDVNGSSANTQTLPALSAVEDGWETTISDVGNNAAANNITVSRAGSDTFLGGATSVVITCNRCAVGVRKAANAAGGSAWVIF